MYFKDKVIRGRKYRYLTKSVRLPDGSVKTLQRLVNDKKNPGLEAATKKYAEYMEGEEKRVNLEYALSKYAADSIFTKQQISKVEEMKVEYNRMLKSFSREQYRDVFDRFTANFTYESNAIEGNSLTLKDVAVVMFDGRSPEGKDLREVYETKNSRHVMDLVLKNKFKVAEKDILRMHKILLKDIDSRIGYKKYPNFLVGSQVQLTPPEKAQEELTNLIRWHDEALEKTHPLRVSAHFHARFEKIHPFADGNGRVGRFLSNIILMRNGYPPLIIRKTQRTSYVKSLGDFDRGYTSTLERFFLEKYKDTYRKFFKVYYKYMD
ncbi:MAG: Fic family protein [Candidatus Altiarchaeota archaeon]